MTARGAKPLIVSLALLWAVALLLTAPAAQAARSEFFGITDEPELNDRARCARLREGALVPPPPAMELR